MQLKALDINGFKSFPDRVQLQFDCGITAVVGPNGSGKSNIADAVRWVLGEQSGKTLRSGKMEDVIFSGTQQRKPMGYASVSLIIDNIDRSLAFDCDEVTINRKLYRSGESEYRINGASVRLKDVHELFMDTGLGRDGYSIIGQGRIAEIVSAKSTQRREIFEEAAGISKYRYRKEQAQKRLEAAQENLLRLKDIILELEGRVEPLRQQSQKAQEYLGLAERKRALEISVWMMTIERSKELLRAQEDKLILAQGDHEDLQRRLSELEQGIQDTYDEIAKCNIETEQKRDEITALSARIGELGSQIAVSSNDIEHNKENILRLRTTIEAQSRSHAQIEEQLQMIGGEERKKQEELGTIEAQDAALREQLLTLERKNGELLREQNDLSSQRAEVQRSLSAEQLKIATSNTMLEQLRQNAEGIDERAQQNEAQIAELRDQLAQVGGLLEGIDEQLVSSQNMKKGYLIKHKSASERLQSLQQEQQALQAEQRGHLQKAKLIEDMEHNMEGFQSSVKYIMNQARSGNLGGIEGPVSKLISVESRYAAAVEVALAGAMQNIVVVSDAAAKYAIAALKNARAGRATFLPMSTIRPRSLEERGLERCEGFVALACDLVKSEEKYEGIVKNLLGRIAVAEDLDSAIAIAKSYRYRFKIVTLDGQVVNPGGSMTGGSMVQNAGLLSRAGEIARLRELAGKVGAQFEEKDHQIKAAGEEAAKLSAQLVGIDADIKTMSEDKIRYEGEQKRLDMALQSSLAQQEDARKRTLEIRQKLEALTKESTSSEDVIQKLRELERSLEEKLSGVQGRAADAAQEIAKVSAESSACGLQALTVRKDLEALQSQKEQLQSQQSERAGQAQDLKEQIAALEQRNGEIKASILQRQSQSEALGSQVEGCNGEIVKLSQRKTELEQKAAQSRQAERELHARGETLARELAKLEERKIAIQSEYDSIITKLYDEYELTLSMAQELAAPIEDMNAANRELVSLRSRIKALGSINVAAIEEYKEVSERYTFMKGQVDDIERSKEELHRLIRDLTRDMKEIFIDNFQKIDHHFGKIFVELFGGGNAKLILTDPEDVLESGIEIYVQPPGKIIKSLQSLSGGEQAFVAIAIYFAILKVHPSPFCLLDEIEAALDDVNVVKYASYLRRLVGKTQFIAITHRRGTMEEADVLYGVTMQEEGVSKLLRLGVSELESKLGMKQ
ncbi:chromosome segregation protein SMC [Harryflintia acetispora]|nr:chromosome segregation protein SMC [Harryflintia acetispora]